MRRLTGQIAWAMASALALCAHAAPGDLDTASFGAGTGKVIAASAGQAWATALQPDGKIIVAGECFNGTTGSDFCLSRYLASGSLDASFNATGTVITVVGSTYSGIRAIAVQPDSKIVAAGNCGVATGLGVCLARYLSTGTLDTSFNGSGTVSTAIASTTDYAYALALQPDGKIVVAGECYGGSSTRENFCLARYRTDGALDTSFNSTGTVMTPIGGAEDSARAIALQPDGKIVVGGYCMVAGDPIFCVARYLSNGALDPSFNGDGKVLTQLGSATIGGLSLPKGFGIAVQPDGKVVAAGICYSSNNTRMCLARYLADGSLDASFNNTGTVIAPTGTSLSEAHALALQADGKILAAGTCSQTSIRFCIFRYLPAGTLDTSYNGTGKVFTALGAVYDDAQAVALQPDGKLVVAGTCRDSMSSSSACLARYEGGPFDARACTMDIDGDNRVLATTDLLIGTRVALGLSGVAVLNGITFAPHATRTTWPAIRDYLVSQCGMSVVP